MHNGPDEIASSERPAAKRPTLGDRLAAAEAENERLQRANDALMNDSLSSWLVVVSDEARALAQIHATLSWRITRPLRLARQVQIKAKEVGLQETASVVLARLKRGGSPRA